MPAAIACLSGSGMARITLSRKRKGVSARKAAPAIRLAASASCQVNPIAPQTTKTKNTLCPIAGASAIGWLPHHPMRKQASAEATQVANRTPPGSIPLFESSAGWTNRM